MLLTKCLTLPLQLFFLCILHVEHTFGRTCTGRWFGKDCDHICNCANNAACTDDDGSCPNSICETHFFGPGCLYKSSAALYGSSNIRTGAYLIDYNLDSCNPDTGATMTGVYYEQYSFPSSWFRIYLRNRMIITNFTVTVNTYDPCENQKIFISNGFIDVACDNVDKFMELVLSGPIAPHVCEIYVSMGANVALKQAANQSSTDSTDPMKSSAQNAVDGNDNSDFDAGSCTKTSNTDDRNWWFLKLKIITFFTHFIIVNRNTNINRLQGFTMEGYNVTGQLLYMYTDTRGQNLDHEVVTRPRGLPLFTLKFTQKVISDVQDRILTICELQVYGDPVCSDGTWGIDCDKTCNCSIDKACHGATGVCADGCTPGTYGRNCLSNCSSSCANGVCGFRYGSCLECFPGFTGVYCDKPCDDGLYGLNCNRSCSTRCTESCNKANGSCLCSGNFAGLDCLECEAGFYAETCNRSCSVHCTDFCNNINGSCLCSGNFVGLDCLECKAGFYGPSCNRSCSARCIDVCDGMSGACLCSGNFTGMDCAECKAGIFGIDCNMACPSYCSDEGCKQDSGLCFSCRNVECNDTFCGTHKEDIITAVNSSFLPYLFIIPSIILLVSLSLFCSTKNKREQDEDH